MGEAERAKSEAWEAEMFRLLVDNVLDYAIFIVDPHRHILSWSRGAERLLGFAREEIVGRKCDLFFTAEDLRDGVPQKELDEALATGRGGDDRWHVRKDGSRFRSSGTVTPLRGADGALRGFATIMRDRTELGRAADAGRERQQQPQPRPVRPGAEQFGPRPGDIWAGEQLAAGQRRLQALFDNTLDAILLADDRARYVEVNTAACTLLGFTREELLHRGVFDITPPPNVEAGRAAWRAFIGQGRQEGEYHITRKDGTTAVVEYRAVANVQPGLHLSVLRDVSERRQAEEALRVSERLFRTLVTNAPVGIFRTDAAGRCVFVNDRWCRITGLAPREAADEGWVRALHPDDRTRVRDEWYAAAAAGREFAAEYRFRTPEGRTAWVHGQAVALRDEAGAVTGHLGTVIDTTEQRRASEALRESEGRLRAIIDNWPSVIFVKDPEGRYLLANRACEPYAGEPVERILGKTDYDYLPAEVADRFRADDRRVLSTGEVSRYEETAPKGGELRTSLTVKFPLRDAAGRPYAVCGIATDVTDLKRADEALRESEQRLRTLSDNLPHGAVYQVTGDREGRRQFSYVSAGIERILGVTPAEVLADASALYGLIHEDDRPRLAAAEEAAVRGCAQFDCEFRSWTRSGGTIWLHCRSAPRPLSSGVIVWEGILMDVTARKHAEDDLAQLTAAAERQRRLYETALSNSADFGYTFDLEGRFTFVNASLLNMWGKEGHEALGKNLFDLDYPPELAERIQRQIREVIETRRPLRDESPYTGRLGTREYEHIFVPVLGAGGAVEAVAGSSRDITDRKNLEVMLRNQAEQLRQADRRKDEFLAMLAHELRNPLAPIRNAAQVIRLLAAADPNVQRSADLIDRQVRTMTRLVDDLLDVSRITTGKIKLQMEPVELAAVAARAVETVRPLIEARRHELTVLLPPEPIRLVGDATRLAQVVGNLLTNAAKYTQEGGHIRLAVAREGDAAVVRVRDNGVGIPADMLRKVFDLFTQVDGSLARSEGGLGIGLTLVKQLVEMHGGAVEAHSGGPGTGSEFVVRLPAPRTPPLRGPGDPGPARDPAPRRILVVDDNVDAADSLALWLRLKGHDVRTAHDGPTALQAAAAFRPDVVLLDLGLPRMDGFEVARRLREQVGPALLVALTGYGQEEDRRRSREAGFDGHLVKPADPAALQAVLGSFAPPDAGG